MSGFKGLVVIGNEPVAVFQDKGHVTTMTLDDMSEKIAQLGSGGVGMSDPEVAELTKVSSALYAAMANGNEGIPTATSAEAYLRGEEAPVGTALSVRDSVPATAPATPGGMG